MQLRPEQLAAQLRKGLAPVYLVSGEEPLLVDEAAAAIRDAARAQDYSEREVWTVEAGFDWSGLLAAGQAMSLFAERRLLELRLPSGKPGETGARVLTQLAERPPEDTVVLVITGKLDKSSRNAKWVKALDKAGASITLYPLEPRDLPAWLGQRMRARGLQPGPGVLEFMAYHFEGNLLAAAQEVEKLALLVGNGAVSADDIQEFLSDNARFNVFGLVDACLQGDARAVVRILQGLRAEGTAPTLILWAMAREARSMRQIAAALAGGGNEDQVFVSHQVWSRRRGLVKQALKRVRPGLWLAVLQRAARADRVIKGRMPGDPWQELQVLGLAVCGLRPPPVL